MSNKLPDKFILTAINLGILSASLKYQNVLKLKMAHFKWAYL